LVLTEFRGPNPGGYVQAVLEIIDPIRSKVASVGKRFHQTLKVETGW
jgi:hypothetical protein